MHFYLVKLNFIIILMVLALLNACTTEAHYAAVKTDNKEFAEDGLNPVSKTPGLNKLNPFFLSDMKKYHVVKNWRSLHSARLIKVGNKTIKSVPDKTRHEDKNIHIKQQTRPGSAKKLKSQQQSIVLIDKKMLKLNFGWPIKGRVIKRFSPSHNKGIDIAGKKGQSVHATEAGHVVYGGQGLIGFGKLLIIKHNDVYLSAYANNSGLLVKEGQHVEKGQVIAEVGGVGIKRTSLHFEIRKNGKPVNPVKLLPKK
jgi:murein DD-endopeptidase MepM/ murein hydrolase activator NlpD